MNGEPPPIDPDLLMQAHILAFKEDHGHAPPQISVSFDLFFALAKGHYLDPCEDSLSSDGQGEDEADQGCFTYQGIDLQFGPEEGWTIHTPIHPPIPIDWEAILLGTP